MAKRTTPNGQSWQAKYDAMRAGNGLKSKRAQLRRLKQIQKIAEITGHCKITDEEIRKCMLKRGYHLVEFCEKYGQGLDWVMYGDPGWTICRGFIDAGVSLRP